MQSTSYDCQAGWITSWNQNCWKKYWQPQIGRWYHSHGRKWKGTKEPLDEHEGEWKSRPQTKLKKKKKKIMASSSITAWQIEGEKVEVVMDFLFLGSKVTADGDCSQEIRRWLLLGRKTVINLDSVLKSRDTTLPTKACIMKAMGLPMVAYSCES